MVVCGCGQWLLLFSYVIAAIFGVGARHVLAFRQQQNDIQSSNTIQSKDSPVVSYSLIIESKRLPGKKRMTITVNGTSPGPVMWVELGQTVEVTILNHIDPLIYSEGLSEMEKNQSSTQMGGTTIHWHGMSQQGSIYNDGVVGLTQCAIPPNQQVLYRFTPSRLGTFWYHGHFNDQYPNGLYGPLVVRPPAFHPLYQQHYHYDESGMREEVLSIADYYQRDYRDLMREYLAPNHTMIDPVPDAFIVNSSFSEEMVIENINRQNKMLLRIVNAGVLSSYRFSVDGVPLTVLEIDGTTIEPVVVPDITLFVAQRVALLLDWSLMHANLMSYDKVWFRFQATVNGAWPEDVYYGSGSGEVLDLQWKGVLHFSSSPLDTSNVVNEKPEYEDNRIPNLSKQYPRIDDMNTMSAKPLPLNLLTNNDVLSEQNHDDTMYHITINNTIAMERDTNRVKAFVNDATFPLQWLASSTSTRPSYPRLPILFTALGYSRDDVSTESTLLPDFSSSSAVSSHRQILGSGAAPFILPHNQTIELTIHGSCCDHHPFHLHGHTFQLIASSDYSSVENNEMHGGNRRLMERDVVIVPAHGWVKVRFRSNNPGLWLFHCHVHSHMNAGMMALFVEAAESFSSLPAIPMDHISICGIESDTMRSNKETAIQLLTVYVLNIAAVIFVMVLVAAVLLIVIRRKGSKLISLMMDGSHGKNSSSQGTERIQMKVLYSSLPVRLDEDDENQAFDDEDENDIWE